MARDQKRGGKRFGPKVSILVWTLLCVLALAAGGLALNVTQRLRRDTQEMTHARQVVQESMRRQEAIASKRTARREFSPAFLQMAFGDNPPLLEQIQKSLQQAISQNPQLSRGDVAMMLVTYRAEGELRDVAVHVFGNLIPQWSPAFSREGYWKSQLPGRFYSIGQSLLSVMGREVLILADKDIEARQREVLDGVLNDHYGVINDYLHDPVSFIAVIPEPGLLLTDQFRPYLAALLIKGKISQDEARIELVALSLDPKRAQELAELLGDMRMMMIGLGRVRFETGPAEAALQQLARAQIRAEGPVVDVRLMVPGVVIERALPRLVQGLSKGMNRIHRGPGYPG